MKAVALLAFAMTMTLLLVGYGSSNVSAQNGPAGQTAVKLPPDIHPDSLSRMPRPKRDQFSTDAEKDAFDAVAKLSATVTATEGVLGPTGTRAEIPELALVYRQMYVELQKKVIDLVGEKYFELAALVACRESNNEPEWNDHEERGMKYLGKDVLEEVRNKQGTKGMDEKEALVVELGNEVHDGKVSSKTFTQLEQAFGRDGTLGITLVIGYYTGNAPLMHTYDQHTDPKRPPPFPDLAAAERP